MINWVIGGIIAVTTVIIIARFIIRLKGEKNGAGCYGCDPAQCHCSVKKD